MIRSIRLVLLATIVGASPSTFADSCQVDNQTDWAFEVVRTYSGGQSTETFNAHTSVTIGTGQIKGKAPSGARVSFSCRDGEYVVIRNDNGKPAIEKR
jgi:hypothetical protein